MGQFSTKVLLKTYTATNIFEYVTEGPNKGQIIMNDEHQIYLAEKMTASSKKAFKSLAINWTHTSVASFDEKGKDTKAVAVKFTKPSNGFSVQLRCIGSDYKVINSLLISGEDLNHLEFSNEGKITFKDVELTLKLGALDKQLMDIRKKTGVDAFKGQAEYFENYLQNHDVSKEVQRDGKKRDDPWYKSFGNEWTDEQKINIEGLLEMLRLPLLKKDINLTKDVKNALKVYEREGSAKIADKAKAMAKIFKDNKKRSTQKDCDEKMSERPVPDTSATPNWLKQKLRKYKKADKKQEDEEAPLTEGQLLQRLRKVKQQLKKLEARKNNDDEKMADEFKAEEEKELQKLIAKKEKLGNQYNEIKNAKKQRNKRRLLKSMML